MRHGKKCSAFWAESSWSHPEPARPTGNVSHRIQHFSQLSCRCTRAGDSALGHTMTAKICRSHSNELAPPSVSAWSVLVHDGGGLGVQEHQVATVKCLISTKPNWLHPECCTLVCNATFLLFNIASLVSYQQSLPQNWCYISSGTYLLMKLIKQENWCVISFCSQFIAVKQRQSEAGIHSRPSSPI